MVNRYLFIAALACSASACVRQGECTLGSEFEPPLCPLALSKVKAVTIVENGGQAAAEANQSLSEDCSTFIIDESIVERFLSLSKTTDEHEAHDTLDYSPCYARGTVALADGRRGDWTIRRYRTGSLTIANNPKQFLYCPDCNFAPFEW
jgi:hypothetical protein